MSASHDDREDPDSGANAAAQSETRMRQALERLSGDRNGERHGGERHGGQAPSRPVQERFGGERTTPRPQGGQPAGFGAAGTRRHRYVQDGEVPVVQLSSTARDRRRDGLPPPVSPQEPQADGTRAALAQERSARIRAEQALERAQATLLGFETRLGHAEITQREAVDLARTREATIARLQADLLELEERLGAAQRDLVEARQRERALETDLENARAGSTDMPLFADEPPPLLRVRRSGPTAAREVTPRASRAPSPAMEAEEPEPVKWWLTPAPVLKRGARRTG